MFNLAILSFICLVLSRFLTTTYQFRLAKLLRDSPASKESFVNLVGENNFNYFVAMADLYDVCRTRFTIYDLFFRPSSDRNSAIAVYGASILFLVWWISTGTVTLPSSLALVMMLISYEYVSYWKDTFIRTVRNPYFQSSLAELHDYYKPTNRVG